MDAKITSVVVTAYRVPTDGPESDGTLAWDSTTMVLAEVGAGTTTGIGYTYADACVAELIQETLTNVVTGRDAMDVTGTHAALVRTVRNLGTEGLTAMAIAALDIALWDLKSRLLSLPLVKLLGQVRPDIPAYGSGGFTSYSLARLQEQLGHWASQGLGSVKMKIGREPPEDLERVRSARRAIGESVELFVDANGAYQTKEALRHAEAFEQYGVTWFEEPVSSDDLAGLAFVRHRAPASLRIAAGEYGYTSFYFRRMLEAGSVDVLQADATRCGGITGMLEAGALAEAFQIPLSAHTAPSVHQHPCCSLNRALNVEYFYDHYRIEHMFFDGAARPVHGQLQPDLSRPGLGLEFKRLDAKPFALG